MTTINRTNVQRLIDRLRAGEGPVLNMKSFYNSQVYGYSTDLEDIMRRETENDWCGTHACIAGHATIMALCDNEELVSPVLQYEEYSMVASTWLGLDPDSDVVENLFFVWTDRDSVEEAVAKLEDLLAT